MNEIQQSLLTAAYSEGAVPPDGSCKCAVILRRALTSDGRWTEQAAEDMYVGEGPSEVGKYYRELISMTDLVRRDNALFTGRGNLLLPAAPHYTECCLTPAGVVEATKLFAERE